MNQFGFSRCKGFTLVELLVSLAVIMALTTVLFWRYPETSVRLTLANMTHTLALLVREAQVRGSAIDSVNSSIGGYGVYIERENPSKVILFGDTVDGSIAMPNNIPIGNGKFEKDTPVNESKTVTTFSTGYTMAKLCSGTGFPFSCSNSINSLTISFTRPNPTPSFFINGVQAADSAVCIEIRSLRAPLPGHVRSVQVFSSGMIKTAVTKCDNSPL